MALDTRPWLTCAIGSGSGCIGTPDSTQWTENHGGADFLNAVDEMGMYQYLVRDTVFHTMNGPYLTNATYVGVTNDEKITVSRTVSTATTDDFVRHLHSFRYTFNEETNGDHYPRFALYTLGGDNYNYVRYPWFAYGSGGSSVDDSDPVEAVSDLINGVSDFRYTSYYSEDAPAGCSIPGSGIGSCWFAMLTDPASNIDQRGHRGIIIRNFHGRLNGETWPPPGDTTVSPFSFNIIKSRQNNAAMNTASIELSLPNSFKDDVAAGLASFKEGDFLTADIELLLPPRQNVDYFGFSQRLRTWITDSGSDASFLEGWKLVANDAAGGDATVTTVFEGELERLYHPRIKVDCATNAAAFNIEIPEDQPGYLPVTIAGVSGETIGPLDKPTDLYLWRWLSATGWVQSDIAYQLEKDVLENTYTYVFILLVETDLHASTWVPCENFYFGASPPTEANPSCA